MVRKRYQIISFLSKLILFSLKFALPNKIASEKKGKRFRREKREMAHNFTLLFSTWEGTIIFSV